MIMQASKETAKHLWLRICAARLMALEQYNTPDESVIADLNNQKNVQHLSSAWLKGLKGAPRVHLVTNSNNLLEDSIETNRAKAACFERGEDAFANTSASSVTNKQPIHQK